MPEVSYLNTGVPRIRFVHQSNINARYSDLFVLNVTLIKLYIFLSIYNKVCVCVCDILILDHHFHVIN